MDFMKTYNSWLNSPFLTPEEKTELLAIKDNTEEIRERFFQNLPFGTAGLRGICNLGTNRMNRFTIALASQAFAETVKASCPSPSVIICYDCRLTSRSFAEISASVFAQNGFEVKMFSALRPTPELSFAIRKLGASCGINITASHNPKNYNGFKVYSNDGSQLSSEDCEKISLKMSSNDFFLYPKNYNFDQLLSQGKITFIPNSIDDDFINAVLSNAIEPKEIKSATDFKIAYTPFHGTGAYIVPKLLKSAGFHHIFTEEKQMITDGNFTYVTDPNPENPTSLDLVEKLGHKHKAQLIIATDPDCDRIGVKVLDESENYTFLSGNQVGILLLEYIITARSRTFTMPLNPAVITTLVTSKLIEKIANYNHIKYYETFTGFKFMAEKIKEISPKEQYILAFEEAFGYMIGDHIRDKDGAVASLLIAELGAYCYNKGTNILAYLENIYKKYGYTHEHSFSVYMYGLDGMEKMNRLMKGLRNAPPSQIAQRQVRLFNDYLNGKSQDLEKKYVSPLEKQGANVVSLILSDESKIYIRPSGTEPKVKFYLHLKGDDRNNLANLAKTIENSMKNIIQQYSEA